MSDSMQTERIQKALARMGLGSRREIEKWVEQGLIKVNGKVATPGQAVKAGDRIIYKNRRLEIKPADKLRPRVLAYHKPEGEVCTRKDEEGRKSVFDNLPRLAQARWISIGRLDINTSGLLLFTNDGELANRMMHPSGEIEREYAVRILGEVKDEDLQKLRDGVELEDGRAHFDNIIDAGGQGANHWYHVILKEGRNREVRRLWEYIGSTVSRLIRVRYGMISLGRNIKQGKFHELSEGEVADLARAVGLDRRPNQKVLGKTDRINLKSAKGKSSVWSNKDKARSRRK